MWGMGGCIARSPCRRFDHSRIVSRESELYGPPSEIRGGGSGHSEISIHPAATGVTWPSPSSGALRRSPSAVARSRRGRGRRGSAIAGELGEQRLDGVCVELAARDASQLHPRLCGSARRTVGAVGDDRVVGVAGGDDARRQRDLLSRRARRDSRRRPSARGSRGSPARGARRRRCAPRGRRRPRRGCASPPTPPRSACPA